MPNESASEALGHITDAAGRLRPHPDGGVDYVRPDERLDLYDEAVPWSVRERHLRRYVDAVCWVMEYREGKRPEYWGDLGAGTGYGASIVASLAAPITVDLYDVVHPAVPRVVGVPGPEMVVHTVDLVAAPDYFDGLEFDVLTAIEFLEHIPREAWSRLLKGIEVSLRPLQDGARQDGCFVGTCPIGHDGPNPLNPHHLFEPTRTTLNLMLYDHFTTVYQREYGRATLTTGEEQAHVMFLCVP